MLSTNCPSIRLFGSSLPILTATQAQKFNFQMAKNVTQTLCCQFSMACGFKTSLSHSCGYKLELLQQGINDYFHSKLNSDEYNDKYRRRAKLRDQTLKKYVGFGRITVEREKHLNDMSVSAFAFGMFPY